MIKKPAITLAGSFPSLCLFFVLLTFSIPELYASDVTVAVDRGKAIFERNCSLCHTVGKGKKIGPDLKGITGKRERDWLVSWISNPEKMVKSGDALANDLVREYGIQMPRFDLSPDEVAAVISYIGSQKDTMQTSPPKEDTKSSDVVFTSRTYMRFFEDARGNRYAPFYEHFDMGFSNKDRMLSFYSSGWLKYDSRTLGADKRETDELTYGFLNYSPFTDRSLLINAGRHFVFEGVASEMIDGISSRWEITPHTGFSLFGGVPVETALDNRKGDLAYGGRAFQRIGKQAEAGISFLREDNKSSRYREEYGTDIWLLPLKALELSGHSFFNSVTDGWMEHSYKLRLFPAERLVISGLFTHSNYRDAFSASTISPFSPDFLGKDEEMTKTAFFAEYLTEQGITISSDLAAYEYKEAGSALYYGAKLGSMIYGISTGLTVHRISGDQEKLRYTEARIYAKKILNRLTLSLDAINLHYDNPFNGLSNAYSVNGTAIYKINTSLNIGADLDYSKNPDFTNNILMMLKLTYNFRKEM